MAIGIRATVDFAFKQILGSPQHSPVTIHFLNAILSDQPAISICVLTSAGLWFTVGLAPAGT